MIEIINQQSTIKKGEFMAEDFEPIIIAFCCNF